MMKTLTRLITLIVAVLTLSSMPAFAQSYTISHTTLNGAINNSQTTLVLTSATQSSGASFGDPAVGQCLFIDNELMTITALSSTTATVRRASAGRVGHSTLSIIWTAPCNAFFTTDPPTFTPNGVDNSTGKAANSIQIECANQPAPWINTANGNIWWCNTKNQIWTGTNYRAITYNSVPLAQ